MLWNWSKSKHWNRTPQGMMFLQLCFVWQSNLIARVLVILLLNKIVQEQFSEYDEFTALGLSAVHLKD